MDEDKPTFEIIHDEPPKRKRKRKPFLPYWYIPWRWMGVAFGAGGVLVLALFALLNPSPASAPPAIPTPPDFNLAVTATPPIPPPAESTPVNIGEFIEDIAHAGDAMVVAGTNTLRLYKNDVLVKVLATYRNDMNNRRFVTAFTPDGEQVAMLSTGQTPDTFQPTATMSIWDTEGNLITNFDAHQGGVFQNYRFAAIRFSPDGRWRATAKYACGTPAATSKSRNWKRWAAARLPWRSARMVSICPPLICLAIGISPLAWARMLSAGTSAI
jgi:hypothetical protein